MKTVLIVFDNQSPQSEKMMVFFDYETLSNYAKDHGYEIRKDADYLDQWNLHQTSKPYNIYEIGEVVVYENSDTEISPYFK